MNKREEIEELSYDEKYELSIKDRDTFFGYYANKLLHFSKEFTSVYNNELTNSTWFKGGKLNACYNCVDRHVLNNPNKTALMYSDNDNGFVSYSYNDLLCNVLIYASIIEELIKGEENPCVTIYLPMSDDVCFIVLACARLGVPHNVVFGGYSSESLKNRMKDCKSNILFTTKEIKRETKTIDFKSNAIEAIQKDLKYLIFVDLENCVKSKGDLMKNQRKKIQEIKITEMIENVKIIDFDKSKESVYWIDCKEVDSEHPLFYLYTSGSTGNPKGLIHTTAGYLLHISLSLMNSFNFTKDKTLLCTADLGWITGHSYSLYGPLLLGATTFVMGGSPFFPSNLRLFELIDKYNITHFYSAPTVIRMLKKLIGDSTEVNNYKMKQLELIGCVGEPINKDAYDWYSKVFRCKVIDTYFQTETGGFLITPIPNNSVFEGECTGKPFFGVEPVVVVEENNNPAEGESTFFESKGINSSYQIKENNLLTNCKTNLRLAKENELGILLIKGGFPGLSRGILNDRERYLNAYFKMYPGFYLTGDEAFTRDSHFYIRGRADDVINVSGHRLSTAEIESACCSHKDVAEAAVVGVNDEITGQGIYIFAVTSFKVENEIIMLLRKKIGPIVRPKKIYIVKALPKTRTGKIMRRVLRALITKQQVGDVSTCANIESISDIKEIIL